MADSSAIFRRFFSTLRVGFRAGIRVKQPFKCTVCGVGEGQLLVELSRQTQSATVPFSMSGICCVTDVPVKRKISTKVRPNPSNVRKIE
jgi:hypothetical protein